MAPSMLPAAMVAASTGQRQAGGGAQLIYGATVSDPVRALLTTSDGAVELLARTDRGGACRRAVPVNRWSASIRTRRYSLIMNFA